MQTLDGFLFSSPPLSFFGLALIFARPKRRNLHGNPRKRLLRRPFRCKSNQDRPFAAKDHMVLGGGQAHYYSRTGTLKQRDLNQ